jgi:hypothetical protein
LHRVLSTDFLAIAYRFDAVVMRDLCAPYASFKVRRI